MQNDKIKRKGAFGALPPKEILKRTSKDLHDFLANMVTIFSIGYSFENNKPFLKVVLSKKDQKMSNSLPKVYKNYEVKYLFEDNPPQFA